VSIVDRLASAAAKMASMPDADLRLAMDRLDGEDRQRTGLQRARHSVAVESVNLDWGAYELACHYDDAGDLEAAARWYRAAAANDFADAALRLGCVLDMLASRCAATVSPGYSSSEGESLVLVSEAARWYADAYAAGYSEAAERLDGMISRHDPDHPQPRAEPAKASQNEASCQAGGLDTIVNENDLITAMSHFRHCSSCQAEFVERGGILPTPEHLPPGKINEAVVSTHIGQFISTRPGFPA
jgi:hypothetical protein